MQRRQFIAATGTVVTAGLAGCGRLAGAETGTLRTSVSDQPGDINDAETLVLGITKVHAATAEDERETVDTEDTEVDLVELQGDAEESIGAGELPTASTRTSS